MHQTADQPKNKKIYVPISVSNMLQVMLEVSHLQFLKEITQTHMYNKIIGHTGINCFISPSRSDNSDGSWPEAEG